MARGLRLSRMNSNARGLLSYMAKCGRQSVPGIVFGSFRPSLIRCNLLTNIASCFVEEHSDGSLPQSRIAHVVFL